MINYPWPTEIQQAIEQSDLIYQLKARAELVHNKADAEDWVKHYNHKEGECPDCFPDLKAGDLVQVVKAGYFYKSWRSAHTATCRGGYYPEPVHQVGWGEILQIHDVYKMRGKSNRYLQVRALKGHILGWINDVHVKLYRPEK